MPTHYLTKEDIAIHFKQHINKKELKAQVVGTTITLNDDQIVIINNQKFSKLAKPDN
jgi:hypothetical protein